MIDGNILKTNNRSQILSRMLSDAIAFERLERLQGAAQPEKKEILGG